jgi:hypothetical protein
MPHSGQSLNNPYTGERIIFRQTSADTRGEVVEFEHYMSPRSAPTFSEHVQLNQEERFEIISGAARYRLNGVDAQAQAGETVRVPAGAFHINCWNAGPDELHLRHSLRPALGADIFFETMFTLAQNGKTNAKGEVNLLQLAVIGSGIESQTYAAGLPIALQRLGLPLLATIGRWMGYRASATTN